MLLSEEIEKRKPIWQALSNLWLDNEMQDFEIRQIVELMQKSKFSLEELTHIFYSEIAPVVYRNTYSMTGEWGGFDSNWLYAEILKNIEKQKRSPVFRLWVNSSIGKYLMTKMVEEDWKKIVRVYSD